MCAAITNPCCGMKEHFDKEGFIFSEHREGLLCNSDPTDLLEKMSNQNHSDEAVKKWMRQ
jgi:hypothetical protein